MTAAQAIDFLVHVANERIADARRDQHALCADLLTQNATVAADVLRAAIAPKPAAPTTTIPSA